MRRSDGVTLVCSSMLLTTGMIFGVAIGYHLWAKWYYAAVLEMSPVVMVMAPLLISACALTLPACRLAMIVTVHQRPMPLLAALVCVMTATLLMLCVGLSSLGGLSRFLREPAALRAGLLRAIDGAHFDPTTGTAIDTLQRDLKCCGADSMDDWFFEGRPRILPSSCASFHPDTTANVSMLCLQNLGCLPIVVRDLRCFANTAAMLAGAMIIATAIALTSCSYSLMDEVIERARCRRTKLVGMGLLSQSLASIVGSPVSSAMTVTPAAQSRRV